MGHEHEGPVLTPPTGQPANGALGSAIPAQRTPEPEPAPEQPASSQQPVSPQQPASPQEPDMPPGVRMCTCGHPEDMHEHYRSGRDCGACGSSVCPSFRDAAEPKGLLRKLLRRR